MTKYFSIYAIFFSIYSTTFSAGAEDYCQNASPEDVIHCFADFEQSVKVGGGLGVANQKQSNNFSQSLGVANEALTFEYNSAALTRNTRDRLSIYGQGLASEQLGRIRFLIEGHTDGTGSAEYNRRLSERRAQSVKKYLVTTFAIDPTRLRISGRGEMDLLDIENPTSEKNRRVVIRKVN